MIIIESNTSQELLIDFLEESVIVEKNTQGVNNLSFTIVRTEKNSSKFGGNGSYEMTREFNKVQLDNEIYVIKTVEENPYDKTVTCTHEFYELTDRLVAAELPDGSNTLSFYLNFIFENTDWNYILHDIDPLVITTEFGRNNPIYLLNVLQESVGFEIQFTSDGKIIEIMERVGVETDFQIRDGHNLSVIRKTVDATGVKTRVRVYYRPDDEGNYQDSVLYTSPYESEYGVKWEKSIYFDGAVEFRAREYAIQNLKRRPDLNIEVEFAKLTEIGYENEMKLGDSLFVIDERMDLVEEVRIVSISEYPFSNRSPVIELSNNIKSFTSSYVDRIAKTDDRRKIIQRGKPIATEQFVKRFVRNMMNP